MTFLKKAIVLCTAFMLIAMEGRAAAASQELQVDSSILGKGDRAEAKHQALTSDLITLYGSRDSSELTYQIPAGASSENQQLVIEYEASDLLISPSSLTVAIDDEPVKTLKLEGISKHKSLKLSLNKSQSAQGYHSVSLNFYGVLKEGVCVRQDTSGNWIKIYPDSRLMLAKNSKSKGATLDHFPYPFAQSGNTDEETAIVIPDKPSSAEIEAAVKTEGYLKSTDSKINITYLNESEAKQINKPTIFIGADRHWNGKVKQLLEQAGLKPEGKKLLLAERILKAKDKQQPVLFVTAKSDHVMADKISVITDQTYTSQLSGETLMIDKLQNNKQTADNELTLANFGADDITIGSANTSSPHYFYPATAVYDKNQSAKLSLKLKKSETIQKAETRSGTAELKVMINGQPHSVRLDELGKEDKAGYYHVSLKVDPKLVQKNRYIDIQFVATGLKQNNPCIDTDEEKWLFIDKSSTLSFPVSDTAASADFQAWPLPYAGDRNNPTLIILPDGVSVSKLKELSLLTDSFGSDAQQAFTIKTSSEVKGKDVKGRHLIFAGGVNQFPLLKGQASTLAVPSDKNGTYDVSGFDMLNETTKQVAFTQASLWDSGYSMAVFAHLSGKGASITKEMISFLDSNNDTATVINETSGQQIFTNHQQLQSQNNDSETEKAGQDKQPDLLYISLLAAIIVIAAILIWYTARRRKRKNDRGRDES